MRLLFTLYCLILMHSAQAQDHLTLYLLPGQGSDHRIFSHLQFPEYVDTVHLHFIMPEENEDMTSYAKRMSAYIDTTKPFAIAGVSLGGMVATEMTRFIHPEMVILLSSASSSEEIPEDYARYREHPVYKWIPSGLFKYSTFVLQPLYEPDRKLERSTCNAMIADKSALFMKRAVHLIVSWNRTEADNTNIRIYQIHGTADHTLPVAQIKADTLILNGSHMMTLTQPGDVSDAIQKALSTLQM